MGKIVWNQFEIGARARGPLPLPPATTAASGQAKPCFPRRSRFKQAVRASLASYGRWQSWWQFGVSFRRPSSFYSKQRAKTASPRLIANSAFDEGLPVCWRRRVGIEPT